MAEESQEGGGKEQGSISRGKDQQCKGPEVRRAGVLAALCGQLERAQDLRPQTRVGAGRGGRSRSHVTAM